MKADIYDLVRSLIADVRLHVLPGPVDLLPLETVYVPMDNVLADSKLQGLAVSSDAPVPSEDDPAFIFFNSRKHRMEPRLVYCHEIGHVVCNHPGSLRNLRVSKWFHDRDEREAWEVAALLLVPLEAIEYGWTREQVAHSCRVPKWLVEAYPLRVF